MPTEYAHHDAASVPCFRLLETYWKAEHLAGPDRWSAFSLGDLEELDRWGEEAWRVGPHDGSLLGELRAELIRRQATEPAASRIHP